MTETLVLSLCCPVCQGDLQMGLDAAQAAQKTGALSCAKCKAKYSVDNGVPKLYVDDNEIIARSDQKRGAQYIIDNERLDALATKVGATRFERKQRRSFYRRISILAIGGWLALGLAGLLLAASFVFGLSFIPTVVLGVFALVLFGIDFVLYRASMSERYQFQLRKLVQLYRSSSLSEFDIHEKHRGDNANESDGGVEEHADTADEPKALWIAERLDAIQSTGKKGLNVGCGGMLHQEISQPYFKRGFRLLGVDIFDQYVQEYSQLFDIDAVQANAMALPFKSNQFDIANFCDILEHLHHPYMGLREIHRVLKTDGVLICSTNYRCRLSRDCVNPLILLERVISVVDDRVLPPRDMVRGYRDMEFYHLDFSRQELVGLIESAGFEITEFFTYLSKRKTLTLSLIHI